MSPKCNVQMSWMSDRNVGSCEMVTMRHLMGATIGGRERTWMYQLAVRDWIGSQAIRA